MSKILVTGGAGFIGSAVIKELIKRGDEVVCVDNFNNYYDPQLKRDRITKFLANSVFKTYKSDIADLIALEKVFQENRFDRICHLAAQAGVRYSLTNPFVYEKSNILGMLNLLELARKYGVKYFVFASSSSVYGGNIKIPFSEADTVDKPISLYAATKKADELMAHAYSHLYGLHCVGLRYFTVYGPWGRPDMALFKFTKSILNNEPIEVYNRGQMERDFTYISDIAAGTLKAIDSGLKYEIFNLGNNQPVKLNYFIEVIEKSLNKKANKKLLPLQPGDVVKTYANIDKAKKMLNWEPKVKAEEGIGKFVDWYKSYYHV